MKFLSKFDVIALGSALLVGAGMAYHLSSRMAPQVLTAALPELSQDATPAGAAADMPLSSNSNAAANTAVFAGGCFWGVQSVFQHTKGVLNAVSGYAGGLATHANYRDVSLGSSGHAEAVEVSFDPSIVSYAQLLQIFFSVAHDPTQLNAQYPDEGPQYRSIVFYVDANQQQLARRYIAQIEASRAFVKPIVTELRPLADNVFHPAEPLHQNFAALYPGNAYIAQFDAPRLERFKTFLPALHRGVPVLVP
ncbi:peptide-methionine (S)-S-oxide reductase MsrA [Rhodoferax sp.]|uniref:peptide-methionine (S)-S-oxide reductase MsrA n=1 Tax=Rhodoferax sp. TaxID=50421 RepID=UPI00275A43B8|nr:peptide-methionine (S)-S-oxide reductase MsrA [Rhodoferax sp.]